MSPSRFVCVADRFALPGVTASSDGGAAARRRKILVDWKTEKSVDGSCCPPAIGIRCAFPPGRVQIRVRVLRQR